MACHSRGGGGGGRLAIDGEGGGPGGGDQEKTKDKEIIHSIEYLYQSLRLLLKDWYFWMTYHVSLFFTRFKDC